MNSRIFLRVHLRSWGYVVVNEVTDFEYQLSEERKSEKIPQDFGQMAQGDFIPRSQVLDVLCSQRIIFV